MNEKLTIEQIKKELQSKTTLQLEEIIKVVEDNIREREKIVAEIEVGAKETMLYPSVEAARNGLLTFWARRDESEKRIKDLNQSISALSKSLNLDPKNNDTTSKQEVNHDLMEKCYQLGSQHKKLVDYVENSKKLITFIKGMIAEKQLDSAPGNLDIYFSALQQPVSKPSGKPTTTKIEDEGMFSSLKKGFFG